MKAYYLVRSADAAILKSCQANSLSHARGKLEALFGEQEGPEQFVCSAADYAAEAKLIKEQMAGHP